MQEDGVKRLAVPARAALAQRVVGPGDAALLDQPGERIDADADVTRSRLRIEVARITHGLSFNERMALAQFSASTSSGRLNLA